jgi:hypothetical protein
MEPEFITYQKFNDAALANELAELLEEDGIDYIIQEQTTGFDPSMVMGNAPIDYAVKIKSNDFEKVNQLVKETEEKNIDGIEKDYYLFSFSDEELVGVIAKADEWSAFDVVLAKKILNERGNNISEKDISKLQEIRIEVLKTPEPPQTTGIILGYICAFGGGLIGLFIGWYLTTAKKTLPDGEKVYVYIESDRTHGQRIFFISLIMFVLVLLHKFGVLFPDI